MPLKNTTTQVMRFLKMCGYKIFFHWHFLACKDTVFKTEHTRQHGGTHSTLYNGAKIIKLLPRQHVSYEELFT